MGLMNLNDNLIDLNKISYVSKCDTHVKAHLGIVLYYFLIVVDGHPIEILTHSKEENDKLREKLIDQLTRVDGYMPG